MEYNEKLFDDLKYILKDYKTRQTKKCIFDSISDYFYRENYHSDILAYYFTYNLPKKALIQWINETIKDDTSDNLQSIPLRFDDYKENNNVVREEGRRDITIFSNNQKNAIIIENKSNNANDMDHQLIRYVDELEEDGIQVDAIIYLNKYTIKEPDMSNWSSDEKNRIKELLICTRLIGKDSFIEKVIQPVLATSEDIRLSALSLEMKELFTNLVYGGNQMNDEEIKEFMELVNKNDNLQDLRKLLNAYNDFPQTSRNYYYQYLKNLQSIGQIPNNIRIGTWSKNCIFVDNIFINKINYAVDFYFYIDKIEISFFVRDEPDFCKYCENLKEKMGHDWVFDTNHEPEQRYYLTNNIKGIEEIEVKNELVRVIKSFDNYLDK